MSTQTDQKHTPGPWEINERYAGTNRYRLDIIGPTDCGRGHYPVCNIPTGFCNQDADAALIAAAPETAEQLDELLELCKQLAQTVFNPDAGCPGEVYDKAQSLISKVERSKTK